MAKEPEDRWPSAAAFVGALDDALDEEAVAEPTRVLAAARRSRRAAGPRRRRHAPRTASGAPGRRRGWGTRRGARARPACRGRRGRRRAHRAAAAATTRAGGPTPPRPGEDGEGREDARSRRRPRRPRRRRPRRRSPRRRPTATPSDDRRSAERPAGTATALGNDPAALQLRAYELNNAGDSAGALQFAQRAVQRCEGSTQVEPCAYALYEYARALRGTGEPATARSRRSRSARQRFPDDQPDAVEQSCVQQARATPAAAARLSASRRAHRGQRQHGLRGVLALVALAAARPRERLLHGLDREHAERARHAGRELDVLDPARRLGADVVVVVGLAADHRAEAGDARVAAGLGQVLRRERQLERAGHVEHVDLDPRRGERALRARRRAAAARSS